jgi:GrpB-like predicted nucleotidyltransferase (UPF0157 family)/L-amino acid N-acyltransferase YncA
VTGVVLRQYDPEWPRSFRRIRAGVEDAVADVAVSIEHVGSTAVPGLAAKPVIDIDVVVAASEKVADAVRRLEQVGYEHEGDLGVTGREAFRSSSRLPDHHLYVVVDGSLPYVEHVLLRDLLRADEGLAEIYADAKKQAAAEHAEDRSAYQQAKSDTIEVLLDRAADRTPRLNDAVVLLNGFRAADASPHLEGEDDETARRFGWWPERSTTETVATAIRRWQHQWVVGGDTRTFAAREVGGGDLVGGCEIRLGSAGVAEISWWTLAARRGQGFATRAARLARDFAFDHLGVERLEARIEPDNFASQAVAQRSGFVEEGVMRRSGADGAGRHDLVLYAVLRADA